MKKIVLVCLALLLMQGVCLAKIEKQVDDFDGSYAYYVDDFWSENYSRTFINSTFNLAFSSKDTIGSPNLIVDFREEDIYSIDSTVKIRIDQTIYTWTTFDSSTRSNNSVNICFDLPSNVYGALMKTEKDISVRFTYHSLSGHYRKDYIIPFKTIQEVQTMYKTYYKNTQPETAMQAAE